MTIKASSYPTSRPTLDLNFAQTKRLDPRVTFTRSSTGTYFDANGVLQSAATNTARFDHNPATGESLGLLVEESRTNSQTNSTRVELFTPVELNIIPNALLAPDGSFTACALIGNTANSNKYAVNPVGFSVSGTTHSFSFYAKSIGNRTSVIVGGTSSAWGTGSVTFDLSAVTATATGSFTGSIAAAGNGWYRCVATRIANASGYGLNIYLGTFQGDGVSGIGIWGLQAEAGSFPTSYIPTPATFTSRASSATYYDASGVIQTAGTNVARSAAFFPDSNGVMRPAGLLLEAAATNNITNNSDFSSWTLSALTLQANVIAGLDGTVTASKIVETSGSTSKIIYKAFSSALTIGVPSTLSLYVKAGERFRVAVTDAQNNHGGYFNLNTFETSVFNGSPTLSIANVGNGWRRCSVTYTPTSSTTCQPRFYIVNDAGSVNYTGDGVSGLYIWGAQLEAGVCATSYIPTAGSTVTRSADVSSSATVTRSADVASITGTNFSSWYNGNQGSFVATCDYKRNSSYNMIMEGVGGGTFRDFSLGVSAGNPNFTTRYSYTSIDVYPTGGPIPNDTFFKIGGVYSSAGTAASFSGGAVQTTGAAASVATPADAMTLGYRTGGSLYLNGHLSRITYWPTRLSNATLQAITL